MYTTNKKKLRGWKRRQKKIDKWFNSARMPNLENFHKNGEDFIKIRIDPWNRLCETIPPNWYFRLILKKLVVIYDLWKTHYENQSTPFDLQLWLNFPNTIRCEVVCTKVNLFGDHREDPYRKSTDSKDLPGEFAENNDTLKNFRWELYDDEDIHFKELSFLDETEIADLLQSGFREEKVVIAGKEDVMFSRKVGNVWIGRK